MEREGRARARAGLWRGQPPTAIRVVWLTAAPFWPTSVVGIERGAGTTRLTRLVARMMRPWRRRMTRMLTVTVFVGLHRSPWAANTECGPSGSVAVNELIGASGSVSKLARGLGVSVAALFEGIDGGEGP
jgi:hypothetical protein